MLLTKKEVNKIKEDYPIGTVIKLIHMDDVQAIPDGTVGTVKHVDDQGQLHMHWENGRGLALVPNVDEFVIISLPSQVEDTIKIIIVEPDNHPYIESIKNCLSEMKQIVEGDVERILLKDNAYLFCNEEGGLLNLKENRMIESDEVSQKIVGTFFICAQEEGEMVSLTDNQIEEYTKKYYEIENHNPNELLLMKGLQ